MIEVLSDGKPVLGAIGFPSGEKHVRLTDVGSEIKIIIRGVCDLMQLGMVVDISRREGAKRIELIMPFIPYARQDQVYMKGDPLSIKVFANFLNTLNFDKVIVYDPHSIVPLSLINNVEVGYSQIQLLKQVLPVSDNLALVAPDLGATKKVKAAAAELGLDIIQCDKTRDPKTGHITSFRVLHGDPNGRHCVIIDDICDGGGTFLGLAKTLEIDGASDMWLCVTHGIFSKGVLKLQNYFSKIYSTDSFPSVPGVEMIETPHLKVLNEQLAVTN